MLELHRCRLIEWNPSAVVALAPSVDGTVVAAARENGDIEIWQVAAGSVGWNCELRIPGRKDSAISSLLWCGATAALPRGRLFSSGLDGHITEWDLGLLCPKVATDSFGGPVWNLAVEPVAGNAHGRPALSNSQSSRPEDEASQSGDSSFDDSDIESERESSGEGSDEEDERELAKQSRVAEERVAVACDDGCLRLFAVDEGVAGLQYRKSFQRVTTGKLLSVAWNQSGTRIVSGGSDGCIRCWDVATGREMLRMTAGTGGVKKSGELCIWTLLVLRDETVVSGDSSGSTQFWDGHFGTLLGAHTRHRGDVLSLAAAPSQRAVFAAGVDGQVVLYQCVAAESSAAGAVSNAPAVGPAGQWVYVAAKRAHSHDVRTLAMAVLPASEGTAEGQMELKAAGAGKRVRKHWLKEQEGEQRNPTPWQAPGVAMLISGGNDAQLFTYPADSFTNFHPYGVCPAPQAPPMHMSTGVVPGGSQPLLIVQQPLGVDVWALDQAVVQEASLMNGHISPEEHAKLDGLANGYLGKRKGESNGQQDNPSSKRSKQSAVSVNGGVRSTLEFEGRPGAAGRARSAPQKPPVLVAQLKAGGPYHVACSAISPDGRHMAISDWSKLRLYDLESQKPAEGIGSAEGQNRSAPLMIRKRKSSRSLPAGHCLAFSPDSVHLIVAARSGGILVWALEEEKVMHKFEHLGSSGAPHMAGPSPAVTLLCTSLDGQWMAAADASGHLSVFNLESLRHHWAVPTLDDSKPTALMFHPNGKELVVATAGNRLHILDVEARGLATWSRKNGDRLPRRLLDLPGGITGLSMGPGMDSSILLAYNSRAMCVINLSKGVAKEDIDDDSQSQPSGKGHPADQDLPGARKEVQGELKGRERGQGKQGSKAKANNFNIVPFADPVLFLGHTGKSTVLAVEKAWAEVLSKFPAPLYYHKYGT